MKLCTSCKVEKELVEFGNRKSSKDGKHIYCIICLRKESKESYPTHKVKINNYREDNKEKIKEHNKIYYSKHKEKINSVIKQWLTDNKESRKEYIKKWKLKNPEKCLIYQKRVNQRNY